MSTDPETFVSALSAADPDRFTQLWSRAYNIHYLSAVSVNLAAVAHSSLKAFSIDYGVADLPQSVDHAVQGALYSIVRCVWELPEHSYTCSRDLAQHFDSVNPTIAFIAIRQFEWHLSSHTIFVADRLISIATGYSGPQPPSPMSIRGIAFAVLYGLDPMYTRWPQLTSARDECINGCAAWSQAGGPGAMRYQRLLCQIKRYAPKAT